MTRSKKGQSDLAPSLFPFLAVLLCTVGALVLILVLVVSQSQASVKQATDTRAERAADLKAQVEVVRDSFRQEREEIQLEIEKKRMSLQGLEQQTNQLSKELEELDKTASLIDKKLLSDETDSQTEVELTELQKKLQAAAQALKTKLEKPTGNKPVFAIVPYEGTSGTHRRPIYLECRVDGVWVQPEGVLIALKDLKPPYGPGNPLDAALRTIRTHYAPADGALNTSAYPLLVVRASGIRTYALARLAMAGWDDQFGYELIEDDMELSYPEGEPGLDKEIQRSLATARSRQAALVLAMPGRYRRAMEELSDDKLDFDEGSQGFDEGPGFGSGAEGLGSDSGNGSGASRAGDLELGGSSGQRGSPENQLGAANQPGELALALPAQSDGVFPGQSGRAGFAFAPDGSRTMSGGGALPMSANGSRGDALQGFSTGGNTSDQASPASAGGKNAGGTWQGPGAPPSEGGAQSFAEGAFSGNQYTRGGGGSQNSGEGGGQLASSSAQGEAQATGSNRAGTFRDAMTAARSKRQGNADSQSSQAASGADNSSAAEAGTGGSQMASPRSEGFGSASANSNEVNVDAPASPSVTLSGRKKEAAEAVAKRKGRNWAWSAGPARDTAIVRTIRIACYEDRWVVLPEQAGKDKPHTVMLDVALQSSAEELAKVIAERVDRWGFALSGGYWKPVLEVEVADGGQLRFDQLRRLLDGSGLDIHTASPKSISRPANK